MPAVLSLLVVAGCLAVSEAFAPFLSFPHGCPGHGAEHLRAPRPAALALRAQLFGFGAKSKEKAPPPTQAARAAAAAGQLKDERGNNVGDTRYTVSYGEDLDTFVEDLPAGTTEEFIRDLAEQLKASGLPQDLRPARITYKNAVVGSEVVDWMLRQRIAPNRRVAVAYGRELVRKAEVIHVARGHDFKDEELFYRFVTPYEKGLLNPQTPYQWFLLWAATPPVTFAVIFAFLFVANLPFLVPGAPDLLGIVPK